MNRRGSGEYRLQPRVLVVSAAILALVCAGFVMDYHAGQSASVPVVSPQLAANAMPQLRSAIAGLPLAFEANQGQTDPKVRFLARGSGYGLFLTADEAVLTLQQSQRAASGPSVVRMGLANANPRASVSGTDELPGKSNYFIGNDPTKWRRNVPQFARVRYAGVYPGIDLVYYGSQGRLEYDFEVSPNADPGQVVLQFEGADKLDLNADGDLVLTADGGDVRLHAPRIYQKVGAEQQPVAGHFALLGKNQAGFSIGNYDRTRELIIDPVLTYSTYVGGTGAEGCTAVAVPNCTAIAVDSASNIYIATPTTSPSFPSGTTTLKGPSDVLIAKFSPNASGSAQLLYSTYVGGTGTETPAGIAVGSGFSVVVAGSTTSTDFPTINGIAPPTPFSAATHAFLVKLDSSGVTLYSTLLGGGGTDTATGLALDTQGKAYLTGTTTSTNFPVTPNSYQTTLKGPSQVFVSKIDPASAGVLSLMYSTYFGGSIPTTGAAVGGGIAVDTNNSIYITGTTNFTDFPVLNAFQPCLDAPTATAPTSPSCSTSVTATDAFVARFSLTNAATSQSLYSLNYSSYLGGTGTDAGYGIAVDSGSNAYVTGFTTSTDFVIPTGPTPVQSTNGGGDDVFLAKVNNPSSVAASLIYFSYLGGSGNDAGMAVVADTLQGARVTGWTDSANFPTTTGAPYTSSGGGRDAFLARFDTVATSTSSGSSSTYLGGSGDDAGTALTLDATSTKTYVAGETTSGNFPTLNPYQGTLQGGSDAFIASFGPTISSGTLTITGVASPNPVGVGNQVTFTYTIANTGTDPIAGIIFVDTQLLNGTNLTSSGNCGNPVTSGNLLTLTCPIGTLNGNSTTTVTVNFTPTSGGALGNSAIVQVTSGNTTFTTAPATPTATITDFSVSANPGTSTVTAGQSADFTVAVTPSGSQNFPNSISLSCSSTLPAGAACNFTNNPIPTLSGAASRALAISTTARTTTTTTTGLWKKGNFLYAVFVPMFGLTFLGLSIGGKMSRTRRVIMGLLVGAFFALVLFQAGCGSKGSTTTTSGTPAGTYNVIVTGTSGSVSRNTTLVLTVQ